MTIQQRLDGIVNLHGNSEDTVCYATWKMNDADTVFAQAIYLSANLANVGENYLDSTVGHITAYFSCDTADDSLLVDLVPGLNIRNLRRYLIGGCPEFDSALVLASANEPTAPESYCIAKQVDGDTTFMDVLEVAVPSALQSMRLDSIKVVKKRTYYHVDFQCNGIQNQDRLRGRLHVHGITVVRPEGTMVYYRKVSNE